MITVVAIDALEYELVEKYHMDHLKQAFYGKTDISEFSEPRTMVLWSSFITGKNMESEILAKGDKEMWNIRIDQNDTFFSKFKDPFVIDLPGYDYEKEQHERERRMLKAYFNSDDEEKDKVRKKYNELAFEHHKKIKQRFLEALYKGHDFLLGYFSIVDVIGHLNFGNNTMMKALYRELDEIVSQIRGKLIVLSDHGMKAIGYFGDHSEYGFWSNNFCDFGTPRITEFAHIISSETSD